MAKLVATCSSGSKFEHSDIRTFKQLWSELEQQLWRRRRRHGTNDDSDNPEELPVSKAVMLTVGRPHSSWSFGEGDKGQLAHGHQAINQSITQSINLPYMLAPEIPEPILTELTPLYLQSVWGGWGYKKNAIHMYPGNIWQITHA